MRECTVETLPKRLHVKTLDEVIAIKNQLERKLLQHPGISAIEIGASETGVKATPSTYVIRVFVQDTALNYEQLGIPRVVEGIPVILGYRRIELQ